MPTDLILGVGIVSAAWGGTAIIRRIAIRGALLDVPNARSSHQIPTPRGGGMAFVGVFLLFLAVWGYPSLPHRLWIGLLGAGVLVAWVGFWDDLGHVSAKWRLAAHFAAAIWGLVWVGGLPPIELFGFLVNLSWVGHGLALLYLVWVLNFFNFMDGIDGIASVETISICIGMAILLGVAGGSVMMVPIGLAAAVAGFLVWNFPKAKIFMGDAGSGFLGLILSLFSVWGAHIRPGFLWAVVVLMGVFVVDATVTLLRRIARGKRPDTAHRNHAYQYAATRYNSHVPVTLGVLAINILWLFPIALAVGTGRIDGTLGVIVAYLPLIALAIKFNAGAPQTDH